MRTLMLALACALALAGCAVPHQRGDLTIEKDAARRADVAEIFDRYRTVRNTAIDLLDSKPLSTVEAGPVLAIDTGSFAVSQRLAKTQKQDTAAAEVTDVLIPRFKKYPLWFYAVVKEKALGINRVQIFERSSSVEPWFLRATPETLSATELPEVRTQGGHALTVDPDNGVGMSMSAQAAATAYASVLGNARSPEAKRISDDSFITQMRATAATNGSLKDVAFAQTWAADAVKYVLRTTDGGVLAFVTFLRQDTYAVRAGLTVTWPAGTPQQAFLSSGISSSGKLSYYHQVLLYIPGGNGEPKALGQYGGVVSADSEAAPIP